MDAIALTAFGLKIDTQNDKNSRFAKMAKRGMDSMTLNPIYYLFGK